MDSMGRPKRASGRIAAAFFRKMFERTSGSISLASFANDKADDKKFPARNEVVKLAAPDADERIERFIAEYDIPGRGTFFAVNVMRGHKRSKDTVAEINALHIDIDFSGVVESERKILAAFRKLRFKPSALVHSGHGLHGYWIFNRPITVTNPPSEREQHEQRLEQLAELLAGDTSAVEVARVLRVPSSHNSKYAHWLDVYVIEELSTWQTYAIDDLAAWLNQTRPLLTRTPKPEPITPTKEEPPSNVYQLFRKETRSKGKFEADEYLARMVMHTGDGINETYTAVVGGMVWAGDLLEQTLNVLLEPTRRVFERDAYASERPWNQKTAVDEITKLYHRLTEKDRKKAEQEAAKSKPYDFDVDPPEELHEGWKPPHYDLFGTFSVPALEPKHVTPRYRDIVFSNSAALGFDAGALHELLLNAFSTVIPATSIGVKPLEHHDDYIERARQWTMIIGETGTRKSPTMKRAAAPITELNIELNKKFQREQRGWESKSKEERATVDLPKRETVVVDDNFSIEGLQETALDNPRGYLIFADEIRAVFAAATRFASNKHSKGSEHSGRSFLLKGYDTAYAGNIRVGKNEFGHVSFNVLGSIQPRLLYQLASEAANDDGMIQRFCFVFVNRETLPKRTEEVASHPLSLHHDLVKQAFHKLSTYHATFVFSSQGDQGRKRMTAWRDEQAELYRDINPALSAALGKWDATFVRRCLINHVIEHVDKTFIPIKISAETVNQVYTYMTEFLFEHMQAFYNLAAANDEHDTLRRIVEFALLRGLPMLSAEDMASGSRQLRQIERRDMRRFMEKLEAMGYGKILARGKNNRHNSIVMEMNPYLFSLNKELRERLKRRNDAWNTSWKAAQKAKAKGSKTGGW